MMMMSGGHHDEQGPGQPHHTEGGGSSPGMAGLRGRHPQHEVNIFGYQDEY